MIKSIKVFIVNNGWLPLLFAVIMSCKTLGVHFFPADIVSYGGLIIMA